MVYSSGPSDPKQIEFKLFELQIMETENQLLIMPNSHILDNKSGEVQFLNANEN